MTAGGQSPRRVSMSEVLSWRFSCVLGTAVGGEGGSVDRVMQ